MKHKLERTIEFSPAYDKRNPEPSKNYGIHGVEMRWILKGSKGVVQFVVYTNWHLPHVVKETDARVLRLAANGVAEDYSDSARLCKPTERLSECQLKCVYHPMAADLGYHSPVQMYDGQSKMEYCQYFDGGCYYDGSTLQAEGVFTLLVEHGGEAVWERLEEEYHSRFGEKVA